MENERLKRQLDFCLEADKEKRIKRQTLLSDCETYENDAEHAWHAALMCILLGEYSNEPIDLLHTVTMLLIHDIVEIDAGDTYAYDESGKATQREREEKAAARLFGLLPEDQSKRLREAWEEFEAGVTAEAKFARAMDNFQPAMLNCATDGREWKRHGVRLADILERNKITPEGSEKLWEYQLESFIMPNVNNGMIAE